MNRQKRNGERGTALILVMIMTVIVTGMIAAMFILTMNAGENAQGHIDRTAALATAEAALNMAIEDAVSFQVDWTNGIGWVEQNRSSSNQDRVWATKTVNGIPCTIVVRSAFQSHTLGTARNIHYMSWPLRTDQDVDGDGTIDEAELFDVYEIIVISGQRQADGTWQGTGKDDYVAGMRAIIEIDQVELPDIIPSPLYIDSDVDPTFVGNATVSGEDHDPEDTRETGAFRMPFEGTIELTYEPLGYAGLKSDFRMIDPETGEEIIIYEDNTGSDTTPVDGRVFTQEEALNFFILTKGSAWGIGDYIHQADQNHINGYDPDSGRTYCKKFVLDGDGKTILNDGRHVDVEFRDGDQNIYEAGTNNVVDPVLVNLDQNLSDYAYDDPTQPGRKIVSLRMGFEDLPAEENPDWDYEDVVVKVDIVQTYCDTCSGAGFLTCGSCEGSGMQNANHACNTCGGDGVVDCPDCSPQQVVDTPWYEMDELQSLTGNPGKNALASSNTVLNTVYPDTEVTEENQSGLVWDTVVRNGGGADNKTTDFRTGKDGFDAEAVANGEMSIEDRPWILVLMQSLPAPWIWMPWPCSL